jgi:hypothetical protein
MKRVILGLAGSAVFILILVLALATRHAPAAFSPGQKAVLNRAVTCRARTIEAGTPVVVIGTSFDRSFVPVQILSKEPIFDGKESWRDCLVPDIALTR